jgi:hypothetical protein
VLQLAAAVLQGDDLLGEPPARGRRRCSAVGLQRECVLAGAVDSQPLVLLLGELAHARRSDGAPQSVVVHDVDQLAVAGRIAGAHVYGVRRAGHRVKAACQHARRFARPDHRCGQGDRAHARQADVVERDSRNLPGDAT